MTFIHGILFFFAVYIQIFLLAFQSRNVNSGNYEAACCTAIMLSATQIFYIKSVAISNPWIMFGISSIAAPCGILSAMLVHKCLFKKKN